MDCPSLRILTGYSISKILQCGSASMNFDVLCHLCQNSDAGSIQGPHPPLYGVRLLCGRKEVSIQRALLKQCIVKGYSSNHFCSFKWLLSASHNPPHCCISYYLSSFTYIFLVTVLLNFLLSSIITHQLFVSFTGKLWNRLLLIL